MFVLYFFIKLAYLGPNFGICSFFDLLSYRRSIFLILIEMYTKYLKYRVWCKISRSNSTISAHLVGSDVGVNTRLLLYYIVPNARALWRIMYISSTSHRARQYIIFIVSVRWHTYYNILCHGSSGFYFSHTTLSCISHHFKRMSHRRDDF